MQYKTVSYKRTKTFDNNESQAIEISAQLDSEDDVELCIAQLMTEVDSMLQVGSYADKNSALSKIKAIETTIKSGSKNKDDHDQT